MATKNFFELLGDDEHDDPAEVVVRANSEDVRPAVGVAKKPVTEKLPNRPATTNEAVREGQRGQYDGARGGRGGRRGRGGRGNYGDRDGGGFREEENYRERSYNNDRIGSNSRDADGFGFVRTRNGEGQSYDGGRGGGGRGRGRGYGERDERPRGYGERDERPRGYGERDERPRGYGERDERPRGYGERDERPRGYGERDERRRGYGERDERPRGYGERDERPRRREFDLQSGNARGGTVEAAKEEDKLAVEGEAENKPQQETSTNATVEEGAAKSIKDHEEDHEMTLEGYEKIREEKRKSLEAEKAAERKVEMDKEFEKMQLVDNKKQDEDFFIKLGQEKEKEKGKREAAEREEKSRKPVSINAFLKPAEGEKYYGPPSSRGRGGRGGRGERDSDRGSFRGVRSWSFGDGGGDAAAPKIQDKNEFPTLGGM